MVYVRNNKNDSVVQRRQLSELLEYEVERQKGTDNGLFVYHNKNFVFILDVSRSICRSNTLKMSFWLAQRIKEV